MGVANAELATRPDNGLARFLEQYGIWLLLLAGLAIRLWLATYDGLQADLRLYQRWAYELSYDWPPGYYDYAFTDYLPLYLYVLEGIGLISRWVYTFDEQTWWYALKIPPIVADLASAYLLYMFLSTKQQRVRLLAAGTYLFLPTVLFIGAFWGQTDSLLALGLLACVYFISRKMPVATALSFTLVFFMKPLAIVALPLLGFWILRDYKPRTWAYCVAAGLALSFILVLPFFPDRPWGIFDEAYRNTNTTTYSALGTYNFFGIFGWLRQDSETTLEISWHHWGFILAIFAELFVLLAFWRARTPGAYALGVTLAILASYTFMSRMHERYLFAAFLPFLAACFHYDRKLLWGSFIALTVILFCQLYVSYWDLSDFGPPAWMSSQRLIDWLSWSPSRWTRPGSLVQAALSLFVVANVVLLIVYAYILNFRIRIEGGFRIEQASGEQPP